MFVLTHGLQASQVHPQRTWETAGIRPQRATELSWIQCHKGVLTIEVPWDGGLGI